MSRLLAFGCSNTYGHGLEDCLLKDNQPGPQPSKFAWPSVLANLLDKQVLNLSEPGSSNQDILRKVLSTKFLHDDMVVILWTHYSRDVLYVENTTTGGVKDSKTGLDYLPVGTWMLTNRDFAGVKDIITSYYHAHFDIDQQIRSWLAKHHVENFLDNIKIKNYHFLSDAKTELEKRPVFLSFKNLQTVELNDIIFTYPRALDNSHPGLLAHKKIAELMYNIVKK